MTGCPALYMALISPTDIGERDRLYVLNHAMLTSSPRSSPSLWSSLHTLWGVRSVVIFCVFFFLTFRLPIQQCTFAAVPAQRLVQHVKEALQNITTERMPKSVHIYFVVWINPLSLNVSSLIFHILCTKIIYENIQAWGILFLVLSDHSAGALEGTRALRSITVLGHGSVV